MHAEVGQQETGTLSRERFVPARDCSVSTENWTQAKPRPCQAMGVSQQELHMRPASCQAWEGRARRARTAPTPALLCSRGCAQHHTRPPAPHSGSQSPANLSYGLAAEVCWRAEVLWPFLLFSVQFHVPVLGYLNPETVQKPLVQKLCPARIAKGKGLAQQMKSECELLPYCLVNTIFCLQEPIGVYKLQHKLLKNKSTGEQRWLEGSAILRLHCIIIPTFLHFFWFILQ